MHGQNDQLRLLRPAEQRALLDRFAGDAVGEPLRAVPGGARRVAGGRGRARRAAATGRGGSRRRRTCCGTASPRSRPSTRSPARTGELTEEARRLAAADDLREAAGTARAASRGATRSDDDATGGGRPGRRGPPPARRVRRPARWPRWTRPRRRRWRSSTTSPASSTGYLDRLDADPERLGQVLGRQAELKALTRKYAADIDGVLAWAEHAARAAGAPRHLRRGARRAGRRARRAGRASSPGTPPRSPAARTAAAPGSPTASTAELGGLAMPDARLLVAVTPRRGRGAADALRVGGRPRGRAPDGVDEVELRLVAHAGAPAAAGAQGRVGR